MSRISASLSLITAMVLTVGYYGFVASDRYVSETSLTVRSSSESASGAGGLASLMGVPSSSREDIMYLKEYIHSLDMLKILNGQIALRTLYSQQTRDPFFNLYKWMNQEQFLWYYRSRVEVVFDDSSGLLKVKAEGFTPEQSQTISLAILKECDRFINELSHKVSREQMAFAESELIKTKQRYQLSKNRLVAFENKHGTLDPKAQAEAKSKLASEIEAKISQKETELSSMLSYLNDTAPQIIALKSDLAALKLQFAKEKMKVASDDPSLKLNDVAARFQDLVVEVGFAEDAYKVALASVEKTRVEASQKVKQLIVIQSPSKPESAEYPRRVYNILTVFVVLSMLMGIIKLIRAIIKEHQL